MPNFCLSHKRVKVLARMRIGALRGGEKPASGRLRQRRRDPAQGPPDFAMKFGPGRQARERNAPAAARRLRGLQELSAMKLFTGSLAAGLVLAGGRRAGAGAAGLTWRHRISTPPMRRRRAGSRAAIRPGPRYGYGPSLLPSTEVYAVLRDNGFSPLGIPQAARLRLHDRGDRSRRRGRPAGDRRAQRPDHPLRAGLPDGGDNYYEEQSALRGPVWRAAAAASRRRPAPDQVRGRAATATAGPCREPHGADAEGQPARRQACAGTGPAGAASRAATPAESRPRRRRPPR